MRVMGVEHRPWTLDHGGNGNAGGGGKSGSGEEEKTRPRRLSKDNSSPGNTRLSLPHVDSGVAAGEQADITTDPATPPRARGCEDGKQGHSAGSTGGWRNHLEPPCLEVRFVRIDLYQYSCVRKFGQNSE